MAMRLHSFFPAAVMFWFLNEAAALGAKSILQPRSSNTVEIPFYTLLDGAFAIYTNATVGTPGQPLVLPILTFWGDTQISNGTDEYGPSSGFDALSSSTFNIVTDTFFNTTEGVDIWYTGEYAEDTLNLNGVVFKNFTFAYILEGAEFTDDFLGLGDKVDEAAVLDLYATPEATFLTSAVAQGLIQSTAYSISYDEPTETLPTGEVLLGGVDTGKIEGDLVTLETTILRGTNTWYDTALAVSVEGMSISQDGNLAEQKFLDPFTSFLVHPGTNGMWLPPDIATAIWAGLGASYDTPVVPEYTVGAVPCSYLTNSTTLNLAFGQGLTIPIPMSHLTVHNGTGVNNAGGPYAEACKLDIYAVNSSISYYSVGHAAMRQMYTVFDLQNNEISIGLRSSSSSTSNILAISSAGVPALNLNPSSSATPTPTPTPSPTPAPSVMSKGLIIGLGVGIPLGVILLAGIIIFSACLVIKRRRAAAPPGPGPDPHEVQTGTTTYYDPNYQAYRQSGVPEKMPPDSLRSASPPTGSPYQQYQPVPTGPQYEQYQGYSPPQIQNTFPGSPETQHKFLGGPVQYSELPGISATNQPQSPQQSPPNSPLHSPRLNP